MLVRRALVAVTVAIALAAPAVSLGAITGTVFRDYNSNGVKNAGGFTAGTGVSATDAGVGSVTVTAFDSSGSQVGTTTSAADGTYSVGVGSATGTVRVEFSTPAGFEPSFAGSQNATSVQFVAPDATNVDYAVNVPGEYCQDNPGLITCLAPATDQMTSFPSASGIITTPAAFSAPQTFASVGYSVSPESALTGGITNVATMDKIGATFGVGVDRKGYAYFGSYVKRHSPYGPAGATNAIYRVNVSTGASSTFATLGNAALPAHSSWKPTGTQFPPYAVDGYRGANQNTQPERYSDVYFKVGRAGLGDVDVTPDGSSLLAVEMTEGTQAAQGGTWPKLWSVPIQANGTAGTAKSIDLTAPSFPGVTCVGKWHPMGIGIRGSRVLIGGVCGGTETRFVDPTTNRTEAAAFILEITVDPADFAQSTFTTIAGFDLDYPKGASSEGQDLKNPTVIQSGLWNNWFDGTPDPSYPGSSLGRSKPMLANIEIMDNGDLTLAFRDRFYDQVKQCGTLSFEWNGNESNPGSILDNWEQSCSPAAAAEVLRLCKTGSGYAREQAGACSNGATGAQPPAFLKNASSSDRSNSPLYYAMAYNLDSNRVSHPYTGIGGIGTMPGSPVVWSTMYDVTNAYQQGLRALGPCPARTGNGLCGPAGAADGAMIGGAVLRPSASSSFPDAPYSFYKGNGLGDLELMCNAAPLQIGNRVWFDKDRDGIQDANEAPIPGVTVHLYNANSVLVGTAITDAQGTYYFQSNLNKPAGGDGTNTGGGLVVGAAFTVKLDNAADFAAGGPLAGWTVTLRNVATQGTAVNSKATPASTVPTAGNMPTISVTAANAGFNNHTYDAGFYRTWSLYGVGSYTWIDTNGDGIQDAGDPPLPGVTVQILNPDGSVPNTYYGTPVAPVTTDASGYYFVGDLNPGTYVARFTLPSGKGYAFTVANAGAPGTDSVVAPPEGGGLVGTSAPFTIAASASGTTTSVNFASADFANLTIDAGAIVQPLYGMGDYTWIDTNRNGIQDPGEPPLAGVSVQLLNPDGTVAKDHDGNPVAPVTTNADGYYFVGNLAAGSYKAQFTLPSGQGYSFTTPDVGVSGTNSKPTPTSNPLVGVTATFEIATSVTGDTTEVNKTDAQLANLTIDAGVVTLSPVGMGDYTWIDTNRNGIQDPGEQPLPGVKVQLLNPDGSIPTDVTGAPVAAATTDITGHYLVVNLKPGSYIARFTIPRGYTFTKAGAGVPGTDSNPTVFNGFVGTTPVFQIASGATGNTTAYAGNPKALFANLTIDAGVVPLVAIGDYVWFDTKKDGIQGKTEKPVKGAKVYLLNPDGTRAKNAYGKTAPVLRTNAKGKYLFDSLLPGSYRVRFVYPPGYAGTLMGKGTPRNNSNPKSAKLNHRVAITPTFTVYGQVKGDTVRQTNPKVNAKFVDPTIDAGIVLDSYSSYPVTG